MGDPSKIRQLLIQFVGNAIKFTTEGFIRLAVRAAQPTAGGTTFRFEVEDSGVGIESAVLNRIFEPFSQGDASLTRKQGGTGIGLAVCKKIADSVMQVRSEPGKGSLFSFEITLKPVTTSVTEAPVKQQKHRVLIVEDNTVNQKVAATLVARAGYEVDVASNGRLALERIKQAEYDAILMDCQMPEMDGYQATREIRRTEGERHTPVIAMTAHAMQGDRERCLSAGMDDYLTKPIDRQELAATLQRWVTGAATVRKLQ
jgi:CheY-like chemotaxis protein/anti-sigma regulatory factor (Ser/Thr protein kinase)